MATKFTEALHEAVGALYSRGYIKDQMAIHMTAEMNLYLRAEANEHNAEPLESLWQIAITEEDTGHAAVVYSIDGEVEVQVDWEPQPVVGLRNAQFYTGGTLMVWSLPRDNTLTSALRSSLTTPIFRQVQPDDDPDAPLGRALWEHQRVRPAPEPSNEWVPTLWNTALWSNLPRPLENLTLRMGDQEVPVVIDPEHPNTLTILSGNHAASITNFTIDTNDLELSTTVTGTSIQPMEEPEDDDKDG